MRLLIFCFRLNENDYFTLSPPRQPTLGVHTTAREATFPLFVAVLGLGRNLRLAGHWTFDCSAVSQNVADETSQEMRVVCSPLRKIEAPVVPSVSSFRSRDGFFGAVFARVFLVSGIIGQNPMNLGARLIPTRSPIIPARSDRTRSADSDGVFVVVRSRKDFRCDVHLRSTLRLLDPRLKPPRNPGP